MNYHEKQLRILENIEKKHARIQERLLQKQERVNERLERERERVNEHMQREVKRAHEHFEKHKGVYDITLSDKQEKIVLAALELLKNEGLNSLSLREIAKKLNMQAPALYWHFKSKEVLVDFMAEAILQQEFSELAPRNGDQTWQDWLVNHMLRLRKAMLAYPDGARVVAGAHPYPAVTLGKLFEYGLGSLHSAGVSLETAGAIVIATTTYTFGYVIEEQSSPSHEQLKDIDLSFFEEWAPLTTKLIHSQQKAPTSPEDDYLIGLRMIVNGAISIDHKK